MLSNNSIRVDLACIFPSNLPIRRVSPISIFSVPTKHFLISSLTFSNLPNWIISSDPDTAFQAHIIIQVETMSTVNSLLPKGAWDTHIHVFDPEKFPYATPRSYTPKEAPVVDYPVALTGCTGLVVVHASMQGSSPAALVDTLNRQSSMPGFQLRGLATIDVDSITDAELDALHAAGVRGARMHEMAWGHGEQKGGEQITKKIKVLASRLARLGWVIGVFCPLPAWAAMADMIRGLDPRVKIVADHFGSTFPGDEKTEDFQTLLSLIREKRLFVKVSGFERLYHGNPAGIDSLETTAKAVIETGPDQIMFGTDWPHTQLGVTRKGKTDEQRLNEIEGFREVDDLAHIKKLREWITDDEIWQKLFITNPQRIFE
jgi:predicted TIM-barrel fold metal-dependent hydrolase